MAASTFVRTIDPTIDLTDNIAPRQIVAESPSELLHILVQLFLRAISTGTLFLLILRLLLQDISEYR
jgi:hypothetical protein